MNNAGIEYIKEDEVISAESAHWLRRDSHLRLPQGIQGKAVHAVDRGRYPHVVRMAAFIGRNVPFRWRRVVRRLPYAAQSREWSSGEPRARQQLLVGHEFGF